jgi:Uma2 family endonuclease
MAGGTHRHAIIIGNLVRRLGNALETSPCIVTPSDVRVRVSDEGLYTYPDIAVVCGKPFFLDQRLDTLLNPVLVIEVLSPNTEAHDRGFKSAQYRTIESL